MAPVFSMLTGPISTERIVLAAIVTVGSSIQLMLFARRVFFAREQHGIEYPAVSGNTDFERVYRAQQNTLEWHPVFMSTLWTSTLFFHPVPSAICGILYLICRQRYFNGYSRSVEGRLPGFRQAVRMLQALGVMAVVGIGGTVVRMVVTRHHGSGWEGGHPVWRWCQ